MNTKNVCLVILLIFCQLLWAAPGNHQNPNSEMQLLQRECIDLYSQLLYKIKVPDSTSKIAQAQNAINTWDEGKIKMALSVLQALRNKKIIEFQSYFNTHDQNAASFHQIVAFYKQLSKLKGRFTNQRKVVSSLAAIEVSALIILGVIKMFNKDVEKIIDKNIYIWMVAALSIAVLNFILFFIPLQSMHQQCNKCLCEGHRVSPDVDLENGLSTNHNDITTCIQNISDELQGLFSDLPNWTDIVENNFQQVDAICKISS